VDGYDATAYKDEGKESVLTVIDQKIAGKKISVAAQSQPVGGEVIDLVEALRPSLQKKKSAAPRRSATPATVSEIEDAGAAPKRKAALRASKPIAMTCIGQHDAIRRTA
jgi:DNA end-binding protein Ku